MSELTSAQLRPFFETFGISAFRPGQGEVIESVLAGEDSICVMPTGGGKSLCYQLPAIARPGVCLVVSPLIALMKDQVDQLHARGISARLINSTQSPAEQSECMRDVRAGEVDLLYIAPERFRSPRFQETLREVPIQLFAVDEAHCISEWGHDFRHEYSRLGEYRERLGSPQTIALTATATQEVRADIAAQLRLKSAQTFVAGFARANLFYCVESASSQAEKLAALADFLGDHPGAGIIYTSSRRACEDVAASLVGERLTGDRGVAVYHAGLPAERRREVQEAFMSGQKPIVVATNAFGMGINKADVRFVIHYQIPGSLESYYQEAGRAGRDGEPATCLMLCSQSDRYIQEFFIESAHPSAGTIAQVYEFLRQHPDDPIELTQQELRDSLGTQLSPEGIGTCERILEKAGALERLEPNRNMAAVRINSDLLTFADTLPRQATNRRRVMQAIEAIVGRRRHERVYLRPEDIAHRAECDLATTQRAIRELKNLPHFDYVPPFRGRALLLLRRDLSFDALGLDLSHVEVRRQLSLKKLDTMFRFARSRRCRQQQILQYFGDNSQQQCGHCDNCRPADGSSLPVGEAPITTTLQESSTLHQATRIVLSGVARCRGRFGKQLVSAMLCGSRAQKVTKWKLHELSTFGLLRPLKQSEVLVIIEELIRGDLLESVEVNRHRPTLQLTEHGVGVMRGTCNADEPMVIPMELISKLKKCVARAAVAPAQPTKTVPPPVEEAPQQKSPAATTGSSPQPASRVHAEPTDVPIEPAAAPHDAGSSRAEPAPATPDYYWTWRLLSEGYSPSDCASIRNVSMEQVWDDAIRAAHSGYAVQSAWFLTTEERIAAASALPDEASGLPWESARQHVQQGVPLRHVHWHFTCQRAKPRD